MRSVSLKLQSGHFNIIHGKECAAHDRTQPFLCYTENDAWHAVCRADHGITYDAVISVAHGSASEDIAITAHNASVVSAALTSGTISLDLRSSSAEFEQLSARRIICSLGRGNASLRAKPIVSAAFECGNGRLDIFLPKTERGYCYSVLHGAGSVIINSVPARRRAVTGSPGGIPVSVKCGLGTVNITEY